MAKCIRCGKPATIFLENLKFCDDCFKVHVEKEFESGIEGHAVHTRLLNKTDKVMVAVSGGKDSMVLWYLLLKFGFEVYAVHINLGYGAFSEESLSKIEEFSKKYNAPFKVYDVKNDFGIDMQKVFEKAKNRPKCSACSIIKRYLMNEIALNLNVDSIATGHNLDDLASTTLKAILNWDKETLSRNSPIVPPYKDKLVKKIKPLYRLSDKEIKTYADLINIPYTSQICPYKIGLPTLSKSKEAMDYLDKEFKGIKRTFYYGFLRNRDMFKEEPIELNECKSCGMPTTSKDYCLFCRLTKDNLELEETQDET